MKQNMIAILDLGSEENSALAREIRAMGVYSEIYPHDISADTLKAMPNLKGIIQKGCNKVEKLKLFQLDLYNRKVILSYCIKVAALQRMHTILLA